MSPDPLGLGDGPNVYAYVAGNPASRVDILGLRAGYPTITCPNVPLGTFSVCCDGNGGYAVCVSETTSSLVDDDQRRCAEEHESLHINQRKRCGFGGDCEKQPRCAQPRGPSSETVQKWECFAYWISQKCLGFTKDPSRRRRLQEENERYARLQHNCDTTKEPWEPGGPPPY
jgi:hypothetical protein